MNFDNMDLLGEILMITNEDGSITFIPEDGATPSEKEMFTQFRETYPNGKPKPVIEPPVPYKSDSERISDLELLILQIGGVI